MLRDLIASTPGAEGKWFAAAKDAGLFTLAAELVSNSPTDPRTLIRATRDFGAEQPAFALVTGMAALRWMARGHGYEITGTDVLDAYDALTLAVTNTGINAAELAQQLNQLLAEPAPYADFLRNILDRRLMNGWKTSSGGCHRWISFRPLQSLLLVHQDCSPRFVGCRIMCTTYIHHHAAHWFSSCRALQGISVNVASL